MRFGAQQGGKIDPVRVKQGALTETYLAACPYFATEKWESSERIDADTSREHFDLLIFLEGHGQHPPRRRTVRLSPDGSMAAAGRAWRISTAARGATSVLRTYVPSDPKEFTTAHGGAGALPREAH